MRNSNCLFLVGVLSAVAVCAGCQSDGAAREQLRSGYTALESQQYEEAISRADAYLNQQPGGPGAAEALYLRGRALEQKISTSPAEARSNLSLARAAYTQALSSNPPQRLTPLIYVGLGNAAYWMDDYVAAQQNLTSAIERLDADDVKAFSLYRIGLCQQRLGQFDAADRTFLQVQRDYPSLEAADRARTHVGFRSFAVQIATFASPQSADAAMTSLRKQGIMSSRVVDPRGRHVITVGPVPNYSQAQALRTRVAGTYPDAMIVP